MEREPFNSGGNNIGYYIDGRRYFGIIRGLLDSLGTGELVSKQFFYLTGWLLHLARGPGQATTAIIGPNGEREDVQTKHGDTLREFYLQDETSSQAPLMSHLLAEKAAAGVDVRAMGWVNPMIFKKIIANQSGGYWNVNVCTLQSIDSLRKYTIGQSQPLARKVCALTTGHKLGAFHHKMVVAHDGIKPWAFIGGIDFSPDRIASEKHGAENWHDMAVAFNGPAVQAFYDYFSNLWREQLSRSITRIEVAGNIIDSVVPGTNPVPVRWSNFPTEIYGNHNIQVAQTLPQYKYAKPEPLSFAPNGIFSVKVAWRKAISNATEYIYIEDQAFWSQEIMDFINRRIKDPESGDLKVILLTGKPDPSDPPNSFRNEAINNHLIVGLSNSQMNRIGFYKRNDIIVHSKVTIIDDHWLFVGSANCMRRSLYTDGEISIGILDADDVLARNVRVDLWGEHFGIRKKERVQLGNLTKALAIWNPVWGNSPPVSFPSSRITKEQLPLPGDPSSYNETLYLWLDADSRKEYPLL